MTYVGMSVFLGGQSCNIARGDAPESQKFWNPHAHTQYEKQLSNFACWLDVRNFFQSRRRPLPWPKNLVTWMLTRDLFAVVNLLILLRILHKLLPSVLWHCWLGDVMDIWPVKHLTPAIIKRSSLGDPARRGVISGK